MFCSLRSWEERTVAGGHARRGIRTRLHHGPMRPTPRASRCSPLNSCRLPKASKVRSFSVRRCRYVARLLDPCSSRLRHAHRRGQRHTRCHACRKPADRLGVASTDEPSNCPFLSQASQPRSTESPASHGDDGGAISTTAFAQRSPTDRQKTTPKRQSVAGTKLRFVPLGHPTCLTWSVPEGSGLISDCADTEWSSQSSHALRSRMTICRS